MVTHIWNAITSFSNIKKCFNIANAKKYKYISFAITFLKDCFLIAKSSTRSKPNVFEPFFCLEKNLKHFYRKT